MVNKKAEIWTVVPDFSDYEVSSMGRVRSWRGNGNGTRSKSAKILSPQLGTNGRPKFELCNGMRSADGNTRSQTKYLHKLVAESFIGPCPDGQVVRHVDGNVMNNSLSNLCYGTQSENVADQVRHGTARLGSKSNLSKLNEESVRAIRSEKNLSAKDLAQKYGTTTNNIYLILSRKTWRHVE